MMMSILLGACLSLLLHLATAEPEMIVAFRGTNPSFRCNSTGTTFWFINHTLHDFRNVEDSLMGRAIQVEVPDFLMGPGPQSVRVMTSYVMDSSMDLKCMVLVSNSREVVSHNASLYIIDLPHPSLTVPEAHEREFLLMWDPVNVPMGFEVKEYAINVSNEKEEVVDSGVVHALSNSYMFTSERSLAQYPVCSRLVFSVVAVLTNGLRSPGKNATWERARDVEMISGASCIQSTQSMQVSFKKPDLCPFQHISYNVTFSLVGDSGGDLMESSCTTTTTTSTSNVQGSGDQSRQKVVMTCLGLDPSRSYRAEIVVSDGQTTMTDQKVCCSDCDPPTPLPPGGLAANTQSVLDGLTRGHIAAIAIVTIVTVVVLIMNVIAVGCVLCKTKNSLHTK